MGGVLCHHSRGFVFRVVEACLVDNIRRNVQYSIIIIISECRKHSDKVVCMF